MDPNGASQIFEAPVPRLTRVTDRWAGKLVPAWGFVAYGVLYFLTVSLCAALAAAVGPLLLYNQIFGKPPKGAADLFAIPLMLAGAALSYWPFVRWARKKRLVARALLQDGVRNTAVVTEASTYVIKYSPITVAILEFAVGDQNLRARASMPGHEITGPGQSHAVLHRPGVPYVAVLIGQTIVAAKLL